MLKGLKDKKPAGIKADEPVRKKTEYSERVVAYFTKEQLGKIKKYAETIGQTEADSTTIRAIVMQFLAKQNLD
jgi:hypothetical protein